MLKLRRDFRQRDSLAKLHCNRSLAGSLPLVAVRYAQSDSGQRHTEMTLLTKLARRYQFVLMLIVVVLFGAITQAQRGVAQSTAQIGATSPLPVYVTNVALLPDGFLPGSRWRFTTYTTPSVFTWTATVNRTSGQWASLTVRTEDGNTSSRWYYIPAMPGSWQQE